MGRGGEQSTTYHGKKRRIHALCIVDRGGAGVGFLLDLINIHKINTMKKKIITGVLACVMSGMAVAADAILWGYDKEISPEYWGTLSDSYKTCSMGKNQTPINIANSYTSNVKHKINIAYKKSAHDVVFNGHTVQVNTKEDTDYLVLDKQKFFLRQFHIHTPSENQIKGKSFPVEMHFVNANAQGQLTVVAVMYELGKPNPEWKKFWQDLSAQENDAKTLTHALDLQKLLPKKRDYYRFSGSLTTPPCSEGVNWIVLKQRLSISEEQLNTFKTLLKNHRNNRPLQPLNGRVVVEG